MSDRKREEKWKKRMGEWYYFIATLLLILKCIIKQWKRDTAGMQISRLQKTHYFI